jgi:hypothetical protein
MIVAGRIETISNLHIKDFLNTCGLDRPRLARGYSTTDQDSITIVDLTKPAGFS